MKTAVDSHDTTSGVHASKKLGQHFLKDPGTIRKIVDALSPTKDETIFEIGPGTGSLTSLLVELAGKVIAIEFDKKLVPVLQERFGSLETFHLIQADALDIDFCAQLPNQSSARLVANLPYNISTAILQRLILQRGCLSQMILMLQREVVERMLASPGSKARGFLSVMVEAYSDSERLFDVSPGCFKPPPKVWSSVVRLNMKTDIAVKVRDEALFWELVSAGFSQKRKTIFNNLRNANGRLGDVVRANGGASIVLCKANVELQRRAETLGLNEWEAIMSAME